MPTRAGFDLVPVRKETKRRLAAAKGARTYDEVLRGLLESAPPAPRPAAKPPRPRQRAPEEQVALARVAAERWRRAVRGGRVVNLGPRLVAWHPEKGGEPLDVERPRRRGLPS